jgi:hypothetical protein
MRTQASETVIADIQFFGGTYGTLWNPDEFVDTDKHGDAIDSGSVESFKGYLDCLGKLYVEALVDEFMPDSEGKVLFESTSSPREYNFGTDRLFVTIDQAFLTEIVESIYGDDDKRDGFDMYLYEHFTSYSSYSNSLEEWRSDFEQDGIGDAGLVVCGAYLSFWILWEDKQSGGKDIETQIYEDIYEGLGNYVRDNWDYEYPLVYEALCELEHDCIVEVSPPPEPGMPSADKQFEYDLDEPLVNTYCAIVTYFNSLKRYVPSDIELTVSTDSKLDVACPGQLALPL